MAAIEPTKRIRILLADDHAVVRAGIRQFLEQFEDLWVIAETSDGIETCQLIEQYRPDVAILDIKMPGKSGIEVIRWTRQKQIPCGILILTAYDDDPYIQAVFKAGANGYVFKTAQPTEIVAAVREIFGGKMVLDAVLTKKIASQVKDG